LRLGEDRLGADQARQPVVYHEESPGQPRIPDIWIDFGSADEAGAFLRLLRHNVWPSPQSAPALAGTPQTRILELCEQR
jgi:hypothetical protein